MNTLAAQPASTRTCPNAPPVQRPFTKGAHTVSAELVFNEDDELIDFVSDHRLRASADGRHFTPQRWSTPLGAHRSIGARRVAAYGEGRWHAPDLEGDFSYVELNVDDITYNSATDRARPQRVQLHRYRRRSASSAMPMPGGNVRRSAEAGGHSGR